MKVLVVDDDFVTRMMLIATVEALGHECLEAADGEQGWASYLAHRPDVVVTDRTMPGIDGLELCRRVRDDHAGRLTSIILVTGRGDADDVLDGVAAGADDYLVKPIEPFELHVRLLIVERLATLYAQLARTTADLEERNQELTRTARTDALTGVGNRRRFDEDLVRIHALAARRCGPYAVAMIDVDHFKAYNDRFGHGEGDEALRRVARAAAAALRGGDVLYRYGGEEFAILYSDAAPPDAEAAADRVRRAVEAATDPSMGADGGVTVSIGVAYSAGETTAAGEVVAAADRALYRAKAGGRNRVVVCEGSSVGPRRS